MSGKNSVPRQTTDDVIGSFTVFKEQNSTCWDKTIWIRQNYVPFYVSFFSIIRQLVNKSKSIVFYLIYRVQFYNPSFTHVLLYILVLLLLVLPVFLTLSISYSISFFWHITSLYQSQSP